jgi:hypothetical protein
MKTAPAMFLIAFVLSIAATDEPDLSALDPHNKTDRAALVRIVETASGASYIPNKKAAKILAGAGYISELLDILQATNNYQVMGAIAETRNEKTLPVFDARLRNEPDNLFLIGSLAYVQNAKAAPILISLLKTHPDSEHPTYDDAVAVILNALMFNRCQAAVPLLRERFRTMKDSQADRKSYYAAVLLSLSDTTGIPFLKSQIANHNSFVLDKLATLCDFMRPSPEIVTIKDLNIFNELLPELIQTTGNSNYFVKRDSARILRYLTRHDFGEDSAKWEAWFSQHKDRHPIYTDDLDETARKCVMQFRSNLEEASQQHSTVADAVYILPKAPQNGYGSHNSFLWLLESHTEGLSPYESSMIRSSFKDIEKLGIVCEAALISHASKRENCLCQKEFPHINIVARLALKTDDAQVRNIILRCFEQACDVIAEYEQNYKKASPSVQ